ncbi:16S rRNA (guanine(527)-N(7))-methyltransferase RsmG [Sphingomonas montana]|uniref:16S rRNA (guanine(527)-N(7))-methyltransferase RsmG n=1 Tax=Sphingomonas montana TaxID=1843236 RepID=UPI00096BE71C|nr:16S rRNA (guanine(527)-N(7))-methyltransferase RsmG [Sphingomonas montana]
MTAPRTTEALLAAYTAMVRDEAARQNLVSAASLDAFETRHIDDSAQLLDLAPPGGHWLDIGSGAGLPGIVLAILGAEVRLVESRRLRATFLADVIAALDLGDRATLHAGRIETMPTERFDRITARAYAPLPKLLDTAVRFSDRATVWILPKGRTASSELDAVRGTWQGAFRVVSSRTDADAAIVVATDVRQTTRRKESR